MCGVVGIFARNEVKQKLYDALIALQHRGQDAAGIVTCKDDELYLRKGNGLVADVFRQHHMDRLRGNMGIGHVRYPTAGSSSSAEAQPMYVNSPYGITLAHNGNLTNAEQLKNELFQDDLRHINTDSDSEVLLNVFARELQRNKVFKPAPADIFRAVNALHARCKGAYAVVALVLGCGMVGFRDEHGIRPLVIGRRQTDSGVEHMLASESAALNLVGFDLLRDVAPGEAVFVDLDGELHSKICGVKREHTPCIFEHVYFARPDSIMDRVSIYKTRLRMGEKLADQIMARYAGAEHTHDIDVVIPIPDTGRTAALPLAHHLNVKYREGFIKNRYIGRTFIMQGHNQRKKSVRQKLNLIELEFKGKNVLLVDDSIVRGTTIREIIQMVRDAGAKRVYIASAAPPVRYPNVYGIDMPSITEFVANNRNPDEIAADIGADWLVFQDLEDLKQCAFEGNTAITNFECSVFDGRYVTGDIDAAYLKKLSLLRTDTNKRNSDSEFSSDNTVIELHNQA
ncbi:MAG: amidophosphoribosyltransferase [Pseudomonadales bacterium]|nr:amidophosphoribosyltransferase [Pseudomonadales bacterium]